MEQTGQDREMITTREEQVGNIIEYGIEDSPGNKIRRFLGGGPGGLFGSCRNETFIPFPTPCNFLESEVL